MKKKVFVALLVIFLIAALPFQVMAAKPGPVVTTTVKYASLGDSIAYGMSAVPASNSYANLFSAYLDGKTSNNYLFSNQGVPGWKTGDLLAALSRKTSTVNTALKGATYVTLCIGANNLLGPIIDAVAAEYGLDPDSATFLTDLQQLISNDATRWNSVLTNLYLSAYFPWGPLHLAMDQGVANFKRDWPLIISAIRSKAPKAQLLVLTVYDPLPAGNQLADLLDPLILSMNSLIVGQAVSSNYKVVDTFNLFRSSPTPPVDFNTATGNFDPHPNNVGHGIIYNELVAKAIAPAA